MKGGGGGTEGGGNKCDHENKGAVGRGGKNGGGGEGGGERSSSSFGSSRFFNFSSLFLGEMSSPEGLGAFFMSSRATSFYQDFFQQRTNYWIFSIKC